MSSLNIFHILILILFMTIILHSCVMLSMWNINHICARRDDVCMGHLVMLVPDIVSVVFMSALLLTWQVCCTAILNSDWLRGKDSWDSVFNCDLYQLVGWHQKSIYIIPQFNCCLNIIWLWLFCGFLSFRIVYTF